ncbi:unnamed protein product [Hydatigera taeniaeformis]|uniref:SCP domain-containing protein n=1 Tax=Hydatigena taeniaeformis TaxID=6205 RepID=A0A0R3WZV3_HYDTA|nr:unnamed protein product [Hydatigera taeniaeformis]
MQSVLVCFLAVLCYAHANKFIDGLVEVHSSIRGNFKYLGKTLAPLKYSKELESLAHVWTATCRMVRPFDSRLNNLGSSVITCPHYRSLKHEWRTRMSMEARAFNPATGQCVGSPCEHYREVVQPNNTEFGCATKRCLISKPKMMFIRLSVCLYRAERQSVTTSSIAISTWTPSTSTSTTKAPMVTGITSEESAIKSEKLNTSLKFLLIDNSTLMEEGENIEDADDENEDDEEGEEEEEEEEEEEDMAKGAKKLANLSLTLFSSLFFAMLLLS